MAQGLDFDIKQTVVFNGSFGPREIEQLIETISRDYSNFKTLREAVDELESKEEQSPASNVRLGVCLYLLGRYHQATSALQTGDGGALAHFYLGKVHAARHEFADAAKSFDLAQKAGYNADDCQLAKADALRTSGNAEDALAILDGLSGAVEQTAEYLYQRGATVACLGGNPTEVIALYERAVEADKSHPGALFGLAMENDRRGNDDHAIDLYKRAVANFPTHVGSLLNLGILYEDRDDYERAIACYGRILDAHPTNERAQLYLKDAQASSDMYYDEDAQKTRDRMSQMFNIPVTDFELSVRSRNCLRTMGIRTLGDLCRHTEQELLGSKNFGETSLTEIQQMLSMKGLRLGQLAPEKHAAAVIETEQLSPDEQAMLEKPISDLNLSVRARKCLNRRGIHTIGELLAYSGDELLECKNFGVTSLNEVREKLGPLGLQLRGD